MSSPDSWASRPVPGQFARGEGFAAGGMKQILGRGVVCGVGEVDEPVDAGGVGPEVGAQQGISAAVGQGVGDVVVVPERYEGAGLGRAVLDGLACVDGQVQAGADELEVVVEAYPGSQRLVIWDDE